MGRRSSATREEYHVRCPSSDRRCHEQAHAWKQGWGQGEGDRRKANTAPRPSGGAKGYDIKKEEKEKREGSKRKYRKHFKEFI
jgi:hypothetical protein